MPDCKTYVDDTLARTREAIDVSWVRHADELFAEAIRQYNADLRDPDSELSKSMKRIGEIGAAMGRAASAHFNVIALVVLSAR